MPEDLGRDLFGDPIVPAKDGRGRPEHAWSLESSNRVLIAFARGMTVKEAATAIGVSVPTLRKHYFSEVAKRDSARVRMEITQLARLNDAAADGNVAAEKELLKQMEKGAMISGARAMERPAKAKQPKLGKKEQLVVDAGAASQSGEWGSLLKH